jgi:hypothetical protein
VTESFSLRGSIEQRNQRRHHRTLSAGPSITAVTGPWQHVWAVNAVRTTSESIYAPINTTDRLLVPELDIASVPAGYLASRRSSIRCTWRSGPPPWAELDLGASPAAERVFRLAPVAPAAARGSGDHAGRVHQLPVVFRFFAGGDNSVRGWL